MIYLNNGIKFYPIELVVFTAKKSIHLKPIVLKVLNQNGLIKQVGKTIIDQTYAFFIVNGLSKRHWPYTEKAAVYIINFTFFSINLDSMSLYEHWVHKINLLVEYIKPPICTLCI